MIPDFQSPIANLPALSSDLDWRFEIGDSK